MNGLKTISKIDVMSAAKITAAIYGIFGLFMGVMVFLFVAVLGSLIAGFVGGGSGFGILAGLIALFVYPIGGVIGGFIAGAVGAIIYNIIAGKVGGIKIQLD